MIGSDEAQTGFCPQTPGLQVMCANHSAKGGHPLGQVAKARDPLEAWQDLPLPQEPQEFSPFPNCGDTKTASKCLLLQLMMNGAK